MTTTEPTTQPTIDGAKLDGPLWYNLDAIAPPLVRAELAQAAERVERMMPDLIDLAEQLIVARREWDRATAAVPFDVITTDPLEELTGWGRFERAFLAVSALFAQVVEPDMPALSDKVRESIGAMPGIEDEHRAALAVLVEGVADWLNE